MQRKNCASSRRWYASVSSPSSASASANSRCVYASGGGVAFTCAESAVSSVMRLVGAKGKEKESVFASVTVSSKNSVRRNRMLLLTAHAGAHRDRSRFAVKPMPRLLTGSTMFWIWLLPDTVTTLSSSSPS